MTRNSIDNVLLCVFLLTLYSGGCNCNYVAMTEEAKMDKGHHEIEDWQILLTFFISMLLNQTGEHINT